MISYRGVETTGCVGMQSVAEPARGLCGHHKPDRFLGIERKRFDKSLASSRALVIKRKGNICVSEDTNDILFRAASVWKELTEYYYIFTYGYKKELHAIRLVFSPEDFSHLAGLHYLRDVAFPRYNSGKIVDKILEGKITYAQLHKGIQFEEYVKPRLEALTRLKDIVEKEFILFSYMPRLYPFTTKIRADYLISSHQDINSFVFIIKTVSEHKVKCDYLCCSAFTKGTRDYEINQRSRTILKKERVHIDTQTTVVFYNRLNVSQKHL